MHEPARWAESLDVAQVARYVVNGLLASAVHFAVLSFNLIVLGMKSAGLATVFAAAFGLSASFLGSRYFVFRKHEEPILHQAAKFGLLYSLIACLHGAVLYGWSDVAHLDYRIGFLIATGMQMVLSFLGNKTLVFRA